MKAEELRIGNLVSSIGIIYKVTSIDIHGNIKGVEGSTSFNLDKTANSIPLTEEWILKFGFDDLGTYGYGRGNFHICLHENEFYFPINNRKVFIKYVHQLQNLYFALTGEDLEIKTEND
jgi:hypothetical protein